MSGENANANTNGVTWSDEESFTREVLSRFHDVTNELSIVEGVTSKLLSASDGILIEVAFRHGTSRSFLVFEPDGEIHPGNVLEAARAHTGSSRLSVLVTRADTARWIASVLGHPVRDVSNGGVMLYEGVSELRDQGRLVLHPRDAPRPRWVVHADGRLTLSTSGSTLVAGHVSESPDAWEIDAPCATEWRSQDGNVSYTVQTSESEFVTHHASRDSLETMWSVLTHPFLPTDVTYLDVAQIMWSGTDGPVPVDTTTAWDEPVSWRYRDAVQWFVKMFMIESPEDPGVISFDTFRSQFTRVYSEIASREPPSSDILMRLLEETVDSTSWFADTDDVKLVTDRRWAIPLEHTP